MNEYQLIELDRITPNPNNPRTCFEGPEFDELVASIKKMGVIEPVIVRPFGENAPRKKALAPVFQLVAGERRFRAAGKAGLSTIPSLVKDLTEKEAFDIMTVENLQREDLTELEEAKAFKTYIDGNGGNAAVKELAARTGINSKYIARRVEVLRLPENILSLWKSGTLLYGHLEQLLRLPDSDIPEYFADLLDPSDKQPWQNKPVPITELKQAIDKRSIPLKQAKFNPVKDGCKLCMSNSSTQADMFGNDLSGNKAHCNNQACFREKQRAFFTEHWPANCNEFKTTGFAFEDEINYNQYEYVHDYTLELAEKLNKNEKCFTCASFITILELTGRVRTKRVCAGEKACFKMIYTEKSSSGSSTSKTSSHGQEFREKLYQDLIPSLASGLDNDDIRQLRLTLASMLHTSHAAITWFKEAHDKQGDNYWYNVSSAWKVIENMDKEALWKAIRKVVSINIKKEDFGHQARHFIASHLGVNLQTDWMLTEEYLKKKTIPEILSLGNTLAIFTDEKAVAFRDNTIKAKKFEACKKKDLIRIILESGVDLAGKVPQEILDVQGE